MADKKDTDRNAGGDTPSKWTPDDARVREIRETERERGEARPFDYPYGERRANVRARRHISREEADADMPPGLSGSYGTTGGGQPAGPARTRPGRSVVGEDPAGTVDRDAAAGERTGEKGAGEGPREAGGEDAGRG